MKSENCHFDLPKEAALREWRNLFLVLLFTSCSLFFSSGYSQTNTIDSLTSLLKTDKEDTNKVNHLNDLGWELMYQNPDTAVLLSKQALELASSPHSGKGRGWTKGMAKSNNNLGVYYFVKVDYPKALEYYFKALKLYEEIGNKKGIAANLNNIGIVYQDQGDYPKAVEYYFKALKIYEEIGNKKGIEGNLSNIGTVYNDQGDYPKALEYFFKALKLNEELGNKKGIAANLGNIGIVYYHQGDYLKALEYYFKALKINEEIGNKNQITNNLNNIGLVYSGQGDYPKALEYFFKALKLSEELGDKNGIAANLGNIGETYIKQKKYKEAEEYLLKALATSTEIGALDLIKGLHELLSNLYSKTNHYQLAYEHYKLFTAVKDSLFNEDKSKEIGRLEMQHEIEMAEMERERKAVEELKIKTQKRERKNLLQYSGMFIGLIIIGLFVTLLGFVKVKPWVAEGIIFFVFLLFFEFLLVLLDPYMDNFTNGEPAYKLLINALVAACIFPLHAFFEKMLKKRLMKKKL